jgi:hypothetical protein
MEFLLYENSVVSAQLAPEFFPLVETLFPFRGWNTDHGKDSDIVFARVVNVVNMHLIGYVLLCYSDCAGLGLRM